MTVTPGDEQTSSTPRNLTPAEVHNVAFKKPPIGKRGYDEEEVDNFLDVVETELSRLIEANEELKNRGGGLDEAALAQVTDQAIAEENRKLAASLQQLDGDHNSLKQRFEQLQRNHEGLQRSSQESGQGNAAAQEQVRAAEQRAQQAEQRAQQQSQQAQQQNQVLQQQVQQLQQQLQDAARNGGASADTHQQAVKVLALAQQTADQHLAESQAESQRLVADAQSQAQKLHQDSSAAAERRVTEAQTRADALHRDSQATAQKTITDAEQRAAAINDALETRKGALEGRVEELRTFEREYRSRLKSYLESQLRDLDHGNRDESDQQNG